ncbi:hypothetical protein GCM10010344_43860 [Streptomyces bluensis]|nr:hypothetical protein GCM10010344_43860 [Streptomyces bluensis]
MGRVALSVPERRKITASRICAVHSSAFMNRLLVVACQYTHGDGAGADECDMGASGPEGDVEGGAQREESGGARPRRAIVQVLSRDGCSGGTAGTPLSPARSFSSY